MKRGLIVGFIMMSSLIAYTQEYAQFRLVSKGLSGRYKVYFFENDKGTYLQDTLKKSELEVGLLNTALNYLSPQWTYLMDYIEGDIRWYVVKRKKPE